MMRNLWAIALLACALAGCQSTYQGTKLGEDGALGADPARNGVPYLLARPRFEVTKDDADKYTVAVGYVPDPTQRYSLRLNPALLADTGFKVNWGDSGALSGLTGSVTDQSVPTLVALLKMTSDVAGGIAAPIGLAQDRSIESGCGASKATADVLICALKLAEGVKVVAAAAGAEPDLPCTPTASKAIRDRLVYFKDHDDKDRGDPLPSLYAATAAEEPCLRKAAAALDASVLAAFGIVPDAGAANVPAANIDTVVQGAKIASLRKLAGDAFDNALTAKADPVGALPAAARTRLIKALDVDQGDAMRRLMAAVARYARTDQTKDTSTFLALFSDKATGSTKDCATAVPGAKPEAPPSQAACIDAVVDGLTKAFAAAGLKTDPVAVRIDLLSRASKISKALKASADLPPDQWASRRIADLDRQEAAAVQAVLRAARQGDPESDSTVRALRAAKATTVGLSPEFKRLGVIRERLDTLPVKDPTGRLSPSVEYAALRDEGDRLDKLLASRLAATQASTPAKAKPEELPPEVPWVSESCVAKSTSLSDWKDTDGVTAPKYVILLRRAGGERQVINPIKEGCGS